MGGGRAESGVLGRMPGAARAAGTGCQAPSGSAARGHFISSLEGPRDADLPTHEVCGGALSAERPSGRAVPPRFGDEGSQLCGGPVT